MTPEPEPTDADVQSEDDDGSWGLSPWKIAAWLGVILAAGSVVVVFFTFAPVYRATARIQIERTPMVLVFPDRYNERRGGDDYVQRQLALINCWEILNPVVNDRRVMDSVPELREVVSQGGDAVPWLQRRLRVARVGNSDLYDISFESCSPKGAKTLVDAVVNEYLMQFQEEQGDYSRMILGVLSREIEVQSQRVQEMQERLHEKARHLPKGLRLLGETDFDPQGPLSQLEARLIEVELDELVQQAEINAWRQTMEEQTIEAPTAVVDARVEEDAEVHRLKALIEAQEAALAVTEAAAAKGPDDPRPKDLRREIAETKQSLEDRRGVVRDRVAQETQRDFQASQEERLASMEYELRILAAKKKILRERYEEERSRLGGATGDWIEWKCEREELDRNEKVLELLENRKLELVTEMGVPGRVKLRYLAPLPVAPANAFPLRGMLLTCLACFLLPLVLVGGYYSARLCFRVAASHRAGGRAV